jgi:predicted membrane protein
MGGSKKKFQMADFKGGEYSAVMGGGEIDLTDCKLNGDAEISIFCLMGGGQIIVPKEWNIYMDVVSIMGGSDIKGAESVSIVDKERNLKITGTAIMGGFEVKRK